jgi:hypothetical protein
MVEGMESEVVLSGSGFESMRPVGLGAVAIAREVKALWVYVLVM